jgi:voltage-gated potassium channel Kch
MTILADIGQFLSKLWGSLKGKTPDQIYSELLADEQTAANWVSGSLGIINQNIAIDSVLVAPIIKSVFPNVDPAAIENTYIQLSAKILAMINDTQTVIPTTLEGAITIVQQYLSGKIGNDWIRAVHDLFSLATSIASPGMPIQKAFLIADFVYNDIITPLLGLHKSSGVVVTPSPVPAPILNGQPA